MKRKLPNEFLFTIVALLISTVIVHALYVLHVRPVAEATMRADRERMLKDPKAAAFIRHFPERWLKLHENSASHFSIRF